MQFAENMPIYTMDGEHVGDIERVVMDPRTKEITHLVVRQGWLFAEDKVLPVDLVVSTSEDGVVLRPIEDDLQALPRFEKTEFIPRDRLAQAKRAKGETTQPATYQQPLYWYPPVGARWWGGGYTAFAYPSPTPYVIVTDRRIPEGTVPLKEGASVTTADGEHAGDISTVIADPDSDRATHLVIEKGWLFTEQKLVPTSWISMVKEDNVQLAVGSKLLDSLPAYNPG
jgi:uncharacterized protein YrrD